MLVKYKGTQSAMTIGIGGGLIRLVPNVNTLLTAAQAKEFQARANTKQLVKAKVIEIASLDKLDKDELIAVAKANGHKLNGKEKVADLVAILSNTDEEDDDAADAADDGSNGTDPDAGDGTGNDE